MKKSGFIVICCMVSCVADAQSKHAFFSYFSIQPNRSVYDRVYPYAYQNGLGLGLEAGFNTETGISPLVDITMDRLRFMDDDVFGTFEGKNLKKNNIRNLFFGTRIQIYKGLNVSFVMGPSFVDSYRYLGMKPGIFYVFGNNGRFQAMVCLTHILASYGNDIKPFGYVNVGIGVRMF